MKDIFSCFVRSIPLSILVVAIGYLIAYFVLGESQKLDFTLFVLGSILIFVFLPSVFGQSRSGVLHSPKIIFRKVDTLEKRNMNAPESIFPALSNVFAGILTWLFGWLTY